MDHTQHSGRALQALLVSLLALGWLPKLPAQTLVLGAIGPDNPSGDVQKMAPLAKYLARELRSAGIRDSRVVVAKNMTHMAGLLREGKADLFIDSVFPTLMVGRLSGSQLLLRRWKKGLGDYQTVVFARKDSGLARLEDLQGKRIAFEEAFSSSGYLFPKVLALQKGLKLAEVDRDFGSLKAGEVGYVFSNDDSNTLLWVVRGKVHAGAMDHQTYQQKAKPYQDQLTVIAESPSMPRQIVSVRASLAPALVARIKDILLQMDQSEEGRKALQAFEATTKFDALSEQALASIARLRKYVAAELVTK